MKSERSSNAFGAIIKNNLKRFWALPLLACLLMFLSGPFLIIAIKDIEIADVFSGYNLLYMMCCALLGTGTGLVVFNYMVSKKASGYIHSLPVTRGRLFAANYISGVVMMLIPLLINCAVMMAAGLMLIHPAASTTAGSLEMMFSSFIIAMTFYSITIFAAAISGNFIMHLFCSGFLNAAVMMVLLVVNGYLEKLMFGYATSSNTFDVILSSFVVLAFRNGANIMIVAIYLGVIAVVSMAAYMIYKGRPVERTGDSLMFGWSKILIMVIVSFLGAGMLGLVLDMMFFESMNISAGMIAGIAAGLLITFVIMALIIDRSPNIVTGKNIVAFLITAAIIGAGIAIPVTDATGYSGKIPSPANTKHVFVTTMCKEQNGWNRLNARLFKGSNAEIGHSLMNSYREDDSLMQLSDDENIIAACEIQKTIVLRKKQIQNHDYSYDGVEMSYLTIFDIDGSKMRRSYPVIDKETFKMMKPHLKKIFESKEFKNAYSFSNLKYSVRSVSVELTDTKDGDAAKTLSEAKTKELLAVLDKDFANMTYEQYTKANDVKEGEEGEEGDSISIELYDRTKLKKKTGTLTDKDYDKTDVGSIDFNISPAYKYTNKWIKENVK